ncbi:MAG: hypothetical protein QNJ54_22420 [Prochloraceae cyanobacterium]|nr:hypothetical protein [Prochloraceae cyanobacterium]
MDLLLPKLKLDSDVKVSDEAGKWDGQDFETFGKVASSLDYKSPGRVKSVSSVPTMWARPISMEMALHNKYYPIRAQMIEQWQGMLAAIALAEPWGFPLSAQLLELGELRHSDLFARSLYELLPDPINALYTLENKNPWQDVYVFLWDGKPVGMSSPSTLVVPAEEGRWEKLPWWNRKDLCLESPHNYINTNHKALLWRWLENLRNELNKHNGKTEALDIVRGLLEEFQSSLGNYPEQRLSLSDNPQFFGVPLNRGVLNALNRPVKAEPQESCVRLIASTNKKGNVPDLIVIDPEIAKAWGESPQNIWIYQDKTLAALNINDLKDGKIIWRDVKWIETKDLFLPEFSFIDLEDALPGAFLPDKAQFLVFKGQNITPLLPLNPLLLDYFTPEDLISKIKLTPLNGSDGPLVRVTLHLPLSGIKNDERNPQNFSIFKDYPIKEENALTEVPVLELWPHFRIKGWREYYGFYYDNQVLASTRPGDKTFQISLPEAKEPHIFQVDRGSYQITRLEEFPAFINCQDKSRNLIGLILLKTPEQLELTASWKVGVDFGTSFTNIYVNRKGNPEPLPLESLHLKIAEAQTESRFPALAEYFIPENFTPLEKPLPLSSLLTTRGRNSQKLAKERPIYEGRIYIPSPSFDPNEEWFETDLKWKNITLNRLFLKHLALHITAMAAKNGVKQIQWALSYPSAFAKSDRIKYARNWQDITKDLETRTGIKHFCPELDNLDYFRTESLATAQYFADLEGQNLVRSTCIDLGGGTSDISIWEADRDRFKLVYQCSVQLAGKQLFTQFLELNPNLLQKFDVDPSEWNGLKEGNFSAKLDVKLRYESDKWLKKRDFLEDDPEFMGLMRLMAIGTAGLYYYVGILLRVLYERQRFSKNEITPVYLGGNGSRLLNWLAIGGRFDRHSEVNELFSLMLSKGSSFDYKKKETRLSTRPKDEVACGLVLSKTRLEGLNKKKPEPVIAGENCLVDLRSISWEEDLDLEGNIQGLDIPELIKVPDFLDDFNLALKELDIDGITPMPAFQGNALEPGYKEKLWDDTHTELETYLVNMRGRAAEDIRVEPPFILGLKALLRVLGKEWAGK